MVNVLASNASLKAALASIESRRFCAKVRSSRFWYSCWSWLSMPAVRLAVRLLELTVGVASGELYSLGRLLPVELML